MAAIITYDIHIPENCDQSKKDRKNQNRDILREVLLAMECVMLSESTYLFAKNLSEKNRSELLQLFEDDDDIIIMDNCSATWHGHHINSEVVNLLTDCFEQK